MGWSEQLFIYCERGLDVSFWAEPLNAISNAAFLVAAFLAYRRIAKLAVPAPAETALAALVAIIGVGSFLFHTIATRWAAVADTVPIGIFVLTYFGYALKRYLSASWLVTGLGLALFLGFAWLGAGIPCGETLRAITAAGRPCLNGSLAYGPAWAALVAISLSLGVLGHPAFKRIAAATVVFTVSLTFRTIDWNVCPSFAIGTHFVWHVLNALTLYLLLSSAIEDRVRTAVAKTRP